MSTVTQQVPNYILGISEQPDELKLPGQVKDLVNAIPDVTLGCIKRPGSKLIKKMTIKNIIKEINKDNKFPKKIIYDYCLKIKNENK